MNPYDSQNSNISVVMIVRNEEEIIGRTLAAVTPYFADVVVVDSGSSDRTVSICRELGARVVESPWLGYGKTRNLAASHALNDWILSLDADEVPDKVLLEHLRCLQPEEGRLYAIRLVTYLGNKPLRRGEFARGPINRLYDRRRVSWSEAIVHESLPFSRDRIILPGIVHHHSFRDASDLWQKTVSYAKLGARNYLKKQKKMSLLKMLAYPLFRFVWIYFYRAGFLDGKEGLLVAKNSAKYTFLKYYFLIRIQRGLEI